jgi:hypothetical protein
MAQVTQVRPNPIENSDYFYRTIMIQKIYGCKEGWVIQYRTGVTFTKLSTLYIPLKWFAKDASSGMRSKLIELEPGAEEPHVDIYYKTDGQGKPTFSFVKLYVRRNIHHPSWGIIDPAVDLSKQFENLSEPDINAFLQNTSAYPTPAPTAQAPEEDKTSSTGA